MATLTHCVAVGCDQNALQFANMLTSCKFGEKQQNALNSLAIYVNWGTLLFHSLAMKQEKDNAIN